MTLALFLEYAAEDQLFYVSVVVTLIVSITLHELAHGWAAIWQGDRTPIETGHMTVNPLVHMGGVSLAALFVLGIAWGMMPVNPLRFRHRWGEVLVALAGPAMNVLLALLAVIGLGLWVRLAPGEAGGAAVNWREFLWVFAWVNGGLAIFNLGPVPPLDGSRVLAGFHPGYARWVQRLENPFVPFMVYFAVVAVLTAKGLGIWTAARAAIEPLYRAIAFG